MLKTIPPRFASNTFLGFPLCTEIDSIEADVAILGIPYGDPYSMDEVTNDQTNAPSAIRLESARLSIGLDQWDFDLGGPLFSGQDIRVVDCGDVPGDPADIKGHYRIAETVVKTILDRRALPVVIGGDHGVPIPVFRAFDGRGPITLVQIDAHIDWRDEINGVREGYSSPIRRASELSHIDRIFQIGMRGQGSARAKEVEDALAYGAEIITAYEVHEKGMDSILDRIPANERYYLTIDADGLDPSVMPAVGSTSRRWVAVSPRANANSRSREEGPIVGYGHRRDHTKEGYQWNIFSNGRTVDPQFHRRHGPGGLLQ